MRVNEICKKSSKEESPTRLQVLCSQQMLKHFIVKAISLVINQHYALHECFFLLSTEEEKKVPRKTATFFRARISCTFAALRLEKVRKSL